MAEDEVVPLEGGDGLARQPVPDEPLPARADGAAAVPLGALLGAAVGVGVAEGGILCAGLDGGAGEAVAVEAAPTVALAP